MNLKLVPSILCLFVFNSLKAQLPAAAFSFNCTKDTVTPCGQTCITLTAMVPAVNEFSDQYTVNKTACFRPNVMPDVPGTSTNLDLDDIYTPALTLPFNFPFYGFLYNSLVIGTNGSVSFDISNAGGFTQWNIQNLDSSLPSTDYDRAIIMGVFHDIDISRTNSPTRQVKYEVVGTAPHRKWILSFYKVPCYVCNEKINNTYQITLYEGLGLVEVHVFEREVCRTWNAGAAMIGMQNYERDKGIMAPGRDAFTTPRWGAVPMNEAWRFAPKEGTPLLKKVELYTAAGELIALGDTVNDGNGNYNVSFNNVCPASGAVTYLVKSTYKRIDNLSEEVYGVDTINIVQASAIIPTVQVQDACPGNADGSITVTSPVGGGYAYSLDSGMTYGVSPFFSNLYPGTYHIAAKDPGTGCTSYVTAIVEQGYNANTQVHYSKNIYCNTEGATLAPVINGIAGGRFSAAPSLVIDSISGSVNIPSSGTGFYAVTYRIVTSDSCTNPIATTTLRIVDTTQFVWTGAINSNWENAANWSCDNLPASSSDVVIYSGSVVINSNVTVNKLSVMPGANLVVSPGYNLTILSP